LKYEIEEKKGTILGELKIGDIFRFAGDKYLSCILMVIETRPYYSASQDVKLMNKSNNHQVKYCVNLGDSN